MQTPISQISSPNATPAPAKREMPSGSAPDGDFQRTLNRQLEQRQANGRAQAQTPAQAAAKPAPAPAPAPANKAAEQAAAEQAHASTNKEAAPADKDSESSESEETVTAEAKPPADPIADMLALVGSIKLAMQQPAGGDASARALARLDGKIDGKSISAAQLLAGQKAAGTGTGTEIGTETVLDDAKGGGFAASLGKAQAGASAQAGKLDAGKLALDAQLAATAKAGAALAEPLPKEATPDLTRLAAPLAPGALQQAAAAAAVPADKLMGRVGTPAWDQQLGQKVVWMAAGGDQSATLTLNPPDLGPLQVVLTVTNDQADAAFMSAQPEVRQALEAALPRLRDMMAEAGIAFGNATVSDGAAQQQGSGQRDGSGGGRGGSGTVTGGEIAIAQNGSRGRPTLGEVDTFA